MYFPNSFFASKAPAIRNGLVDYWRFENNGNDAVGDNFLLDHTTTNYTSAGKFGNALDLSDGDIQKYLYHATTPTSSLSLAGDRTFVFWFKILDGDNSNKLICGKWSDAFGIEYGIEATALAAAIFIQTDGPDSFYAVSPPSTSLLDSSQWHLGIYWIDTSRKILGAYTDNKPIGIAPYKGNVLITNDNFYVGNNGDGTNFVSDHQIDELAIYNRVLTADERQYIWNQSNGRILNS